MSLPPSTPTSHSSTTAQTVQDLQEQALRAFEHVVGHTPGFRVRPGQHRMAELVADVLGDYRKVVAGLEELLEELPR